jgi:hypothetical protein
MLALSLLLACSLTADPTADPTEEPQTPVCTNTCGDYTSSWSTACPAGERCIEFKNSCDYSVSLSYQVGCNGDGNPGSPQCNCTTGPELKKGASAYWTIVDGNYDDCTPWTPACLTEGLAVLVNKLGDTCAAGTRVEFTAGNHANPYGRFDSYNLDIEKTFYSIPVSFRPDISCAHDAGNHDCRPLYCGSADCPDAYASPTAGGCADGRSPQAGCQDTFVEERGYVVEYCAAEEPSCQDAKPCSR